MDQDSFEVDPDVARARTLNERIHFDPEAHAKVIDQVFPTSWQLLPIALVADRILPLTLLERSLDEPLVLTRDDDANERLLSNVCTHRGAILAEVPGDGTGLRCRYHGRRFGLDGAMTTCPGFEDAKDFPRADEDLRSLPIEHVGPLRFTSLDPRVPFDEWAAPLRRTLSEYDGETFTFDPDASRTFDIDASWALYCENYLEGFHIPFVHPGLNRGLDFARYRTEIEPYAVRQLGIASDESTRLRSRPGEDVVADYLWMYPNLMVNAYPWGISVNLIEPTGAGTCRVKYLRWVARDELVEEGVGSALDEVEIEDQEVVLSVQRGVRSRLYPGGRFSPKLETGPHHFQRLMAADITRA